MKICELMPDAHESASSFYGKALILWTDTGDVVLMSYGTPVCKVTKSGEFMRIWPGYSATTMRHVNSFLTLMRLPRENKSWWLQLPAKQN